jgi:hypothetical protein
MVALKLLRTSSYLHNRSRPYQSGNGLPLFPVILQAFKKELMLIVAPAANLVRVLSTQLECASATQ